MLKMPEMSNSTEDSTLRFEPGLHFAATSPLQLPGFGYAQSRNFCGSTAKHFNQENSLAHSKYFC